MFKQEISSGLLQMGYCNMEDQTQLPITGLVGGGGQGWSPVQKTAEEPDGSLVK